MSSLTLAEHSRRLSTILDTVLQAEDRRAFVFPANPADRIKRVANWGWLRRAATGYGEPGLLHPLVGTAFYVRQWRYAPNQDGGRGILRHEKFAPVLIARLSDGRIFADQWSDPSVLHDALTRWRNARGYLVDWEAIGTDPPTCAIGGLDWATIPDTITLHRSRVARERALADERGAS